MLTFISEITLLFVEVIASDRTANNSVISVYDGTAIR